MGILKINKSSPRERSSDSDFPAELRRRSLDEDRYSPAMRPSYSYFWGGVLFLALILCVVGAVGYWLSVSTSGVKAKSVYAYFELRTLGPTSRPVPGARVYHKKNQVGVTDSYGEWRRFMKVRVGSKVTFHVRKKQGGQLLYGKKIFQLPRDIAVGREPELSGSIQLKFAKRQPKVRSIEPSASAVVAGTVESIRPALSQSKKATDKEVFLATSRFYRSVWFSVMDSQAGDSLAEKKTAQLRSFVVPRLKNFAKSWGLLLSPQAEWQISIRHLPIDASGGKIPGLIRVVSNQYGDTEKIDFLRNYTGSAEKTARVILRGLKSHVAYPHWVFATDSRQVALKQQPQQQFWTVKGGDRLTDGSRVLQPVKFDSRRRLSTLGDCGRSRCLFYSAKAPSFPPFSSWKHYSVKIYGAPSSSLSVYVSGIKAKFIGSKTWRFWGTNKANMYLAVAHGQKVIARKLIRPKRDGVIVSLPKPEVVRKSPQ